MLKDLKLESDVNAVTDIVGTTDTHAQEKVKLFQCKWLFSWTFLGHPLEDATYFEDRISLLSQSLGIPSQTFLEVCHKMNCEVNAPRFFMIFRKLGLQYFFFFAAL